MYQYFVKIVPTVYNKLTGQVYTTLPALNYLIYSTIMLCGRWLKPISFLLLGIKRLLMLLLGQLGFLVCW